MIFSAQQDVQPGNKIKNSAKMLTYNEIAMHVVEHVTSGFNVARFNMCERGEISRDVFEGEVKSYIRNAYSVNEEQVSAIYELFSRFVWSYYIIDTLIADPDISDIRIIDARHVYVKRRGVRSLSGVRFNNDEDYERFIERVALKNKINMEITMP